MSPPTAAVAVASVRGKLVAETIKLSAVIAPPTDADVRPSTVAAALTTPTPTPKPSTYPSTSANAVDRLPAVTLMSPTVAVKLASMTSALIVVFTVALAVLTPTATAPPPTAIESVCEMSATDVAFTVIDVAFTVGFDTTPPV